MIETSFFTQVFNYLYIRNHAANFVKICNIYANQMIAKVAISILNSDKSECRRFIFWRHFSGYSVYTMCSMLRTTYPPKTVVVLLHIT